MTESLKIILDITVDEKETTESMKRRIVHALAEADIDATLEVIDRE